MSTQKDYKKHELVIRDAVELNYGYLYVLPHFKKMKDSEMMEGRHFYRSFSDLQEAYPIAQDIRKATEDKVNKIPAVGSTTPKLKGNRKGIMSLKYKDNVGGNTITQEMDISRLPNVVRFTAPLCVVCGLPGSGAHRCAVCKKLTHVICGTGVGMEGYGQKIICFKCKPEETPEKLAKKVVERIEKTTSKRTIPRKVGPAPAD